MHVAGPKSEHIKKKKNKANTKEIQIKMSFAIGDVPIKLKATTAQIDEEVKQTMQTLVQLYDNRPILKPPCLRRVTNNQSTKYT